jgi:hypothetical protein
MPQAKITIDDAEFRNWINAAPEREEQMRKTFISEGSQIVESVMIANTPVHSGAMAASVMAVEEENGFSVYPAVRYARFVEYGTGLFSKNPHLIYPKKSRVLHFESRGKEIFARYTIGQPGQFFVRKTRQMIKPMLCNLLERLLKEIFHAG